MDYHSPKPPPKEYPAKPRCGCSSKALEHCGEMVREARYELDDILDHLAPPPPVHPCDDPPPLVTRPRTNTAANLQSRGPFKMEDSTPGEYRVGSICTHQALDMFNPVELLRLSGRKEPDRIARGRPQMCLENAVNDCSDMERLTQETIHEAAKGCGPRSTNTSCGKACGEYTTGCDLVKYNCRYATVEHQRNLIDECTYYRPKQITAPNVLRNSNRYAQQAMADYRYWER